MKKRIFGVACVLVCSLMLVTMLSSCEESPLESKTLVVVNNSASAINHVSIVQCISGAKGSTPNALAIGETIAVGESKTFYLAPYASGLSTLRITNNNSESDTVDFTYKYLIDGKNESITVTFTYDTTLDAGTSTGTGSGVSISRIG
ncbi:MAG: hypothetical protein RBR15_16395 [Sphaerochaeta sp.]|nr:hypothetical protein [Sphaerochaeta sp.]